MDSYDLIEDEPLADDFIVHTMDEKRRKYKNRKAFKFVINRKGKVSDYEMDEVFLEV